MKNVIKIFQPVISERTIKYVYEISGEWSEAFNLSENFFVEYSCNISNIPFGIAVIPFYVIYFPLYGYMTPMCILKSAIKPF